MREEKKRKSSWKLQRREVGVERGVSEATKVKDNKTKGTREKVKQLTNKQKK